ncbi:putative primase [Bodo saltans virus]|uniref:Primase n=1 Tax=Bodo saltans virus TaxID=2024608 RepID=A0A2H4UUC2_9VIRU|nr:putative primase [Bodo saltans virus]ATZ80508.1 putative primase [Bodo saltans virus]
MKDEVDKYTEKNLVGFSINIEQKEKNDKWKKDIKFPPKWTDIKETSYKKGTNGFALLTGEINKIIIIDIDNIAHWNTLLNEYEETEPITVKAESGSGGIHLYFKYTNELKYITSTDHKFGKEYDIDLKTNGGCIIAPPTTYFNKNLNKNVSYKWINSIHDMKPIEMPEWLQNIIKNPITKVKDTKIKNTICDNENDSENNDNLKKKCCENIHETKLEEIDDTDFTEDDIERIVKMFSKLRAEGYSDWINVGMCLYNLNKEYRYIWKEFSKLSKKYNDKENVEKWKSFKNDKNGLKIGSLLLWAKEDNPEAYAQFINERNLNKMIIAKYPNDKLELGSVVNVSDICKYINLNNTECLIKGTTHDGTPTNYIEITKDCISLKCSHINCFGKMLYKHFSMTKNETNMAFNGNVFNINVNNGTDDDLIEFQKIELFDDEKMNELIYKSLNGKPAPFADIIYHMYPDKYMFAEDDTWFVFDGNKWFCINRKNTDLRIIIKQEFTSLYLKLKNYFIAKEGKTSKSVKTIKQIMANFDDTVFRNNVITELADLYLGSKNKKLNFLQKLDTNQYLIGFENGVFDLRNFEFRNGKPEDNISITTGYDYIDTHTEKYNELLKFLEDIQPNKDERDYMLTYLSIGLFGNQLELFTILTGCGRNGKSKLVELLKLTFGEYFGSVQSQLFTRLRPDANSPDPGLLSLMRKKVVIASEPEKNSKLNSGFIKFITGRDSTTLRNCHSNDMVEFTARFITLLICNDIPDCDDIDNAFSKRLRCINFPTEFVDNPIKDNQKKIDTSINENFEYWKLDFMLLLIEYYKKYCKTNILVATENILAWTNIYKENTDVYLEFLNLFLVKKEGERVHCVNLYTKFKEWFKFNNPTTKIPNNRDFVIGIKKYHSVVNVRIDTKTQLGLFNYMLIDD